MASRSKLPICIANDLRRFQLKMAEHSIRKEFHKAPQRTERSICMEQTIVKENKTPRTLEELNLIDDFL